MEEQRGSEAGHRRALWIGDDLWAKLNESARLEAVERGESVSAAEWVRRAIAERLGRQDRRRKGRK